MASQAFRSQGEQLVKDLEACGRPFLKASKAEISVSELEDDPVWEILNDLTALPTQLHLAGDKRLSFADAAVLYRSCILDTLCGVLTRLKWRQFRSQLDALATPGRGFILAGHALTCILELLRAWRRVLPHTDAETARLEVFGRYFLRGKRAALLIETESRAVE